MKIASWFKELLWAFFAFIILSTGILVAKHYSIASNLSSQALSATTQSLLKKIDAPITLTLFSNDAQDYHQAEFLIANYREIKPDIQLDWQHDAYAHSADYQGPALLVTVKEQHDVIDLLRTPLNEATLSQSLFKVRNHHDQWIVFLQGHDEPSPFGTQGRDYDLLRIALQNQGFKVQTLSLAQTPFIADNTRLLVIASPKTALLPKEEQLIAQYLFQGGSLLWLVDKESHPQPFLSELFYVDALPGTVVDLHGHQLGTPHPAITIVDQYPTLPFKAPNTLTAFPFAVALKAQNNNDWQTQPLLVSHERTWTESGSLSGALAYEPEKNEIAGPLVLGVSLTKKPTFHSQQQQRVAIIGNSRFISNGVIENYGNLAFGLNLIHWLGHDDYLLTLEQPVNHDELLQIHLFTGLLIQYGFPLGIVFLTCFGAATYLRRIIQSR